MKKIVVIGSLNMDLVTQTDILPLVGETVRGNTFRTICGGKGANQACAAAKLGGNVAMCGCVGNDSFGDDLIAGLTEAGADCSPVSKLDNADTGTASITVSAGNNSIIIVAGANGEVSIDYIDKNWDDIKNCDFVILQLEIPIPTVEYIVKKCKAAGIPVMLNPSPTYDLSEEIFEGLDYIIVNEFECGYYAGMEVVTPEDAKVGIGKLLERGIKQAIVTLGSKGCMYTDGDELKMEPARKVNAVDSTAAGDTFTAGIAVKLMEGAGMEEAIKFATKCSAIAVTRAGAQTSMPSREEVDAME